MNNSTKTSKLTRYFEVVGTIDGTREVLFGSFVRADCIGEIDAEIESWRADGYRNVTIVSRETTDAPDLKVYAESIVTSHELFMQQAPSFNFELSEAQILARALNVGFVALITGQDDLYLINKNYGEAVK